MKGYVHLYTGDGKGKTTAAFGLSIRAAGAGKKVFIAQFVKGMKYSELKALERIPEIEVRQYGLKCFIISQPTEADFQAARRGLKEITKLIIGNKYDVVVLDEICIALYYNLIGLEEVLKLIEKKPLPMELVLTGRNAPEALVERAELVTEMKEIKHYYNEGVEARRGIEF
ncbi:MAG TPA: cob(I)yrinic acid a,c-diamide adenosyltransferase [Bacteroidales bacterium]|nr:cob(I)yrinic acid a,c-diamide adenosyltransferase [Bacteroidales bacterium]HPT01049.1 cob(I)yrinic acid a,c-diamide adenosyltransferase [Bacteroidales bacterium]